MRFLKNLDRRVFCFLNRISFEVQIILLIALACAGAWAILALILLGFYLKLF